MKNFSKSKLCWILSFGTTALLCFVIALSMMFGIPQANADTTGETSPTLEITYNYEKYKTLGDLSDELAKIGYTFAETVDKTQLVLVGTNTYSARATGSDVAEDITIKVNAPVARKIESFVDETSDVNIGAAANVRSVWIDDGVENGTNYNIYTKVTDDDTNANKYDGNISIESTAGSNQGAGVNLKWTSKFDMIQFRMTYYSGAAYTFGMMRAYDYAHYQFGNTGVGGFAIAIQNNNLGFRRYDASKKAISAFENHSGWSGAGFKRNANGGVQDGDSFIVTYGIYPTTYTNSDGETKDAYAIYFKSEYAANGYTIEKTVYDTGFSSLYLRLADDLRFSIGYHRNVSTKNPKMSIEGVNKPLFTKGLYDTNIETSYDEGAELSTVTLPENYSWKDATQKLVFGTNEYLANYTFDYHEKTCVLSAKVNILNILTQARTVAQFYVDGNHITTLSGKVSDSAVLNFVDVQYSVSDTVAIGWLAEIDGVNKLYPLDYEWTVIEEANLTFNLATVDFKVYNGASIRTQTTFEYAGGLRFLAMYNSEDMANYQAFIKNAYGVIVPSNDPTYFANGAFTTDALAKNGGDMLKTSAYTYEDVHFASDYSEYGFYTFAISNIKYHNYNRQFAAVNYIVIEYADGTTKDILSNYIERSVYDVAVSTMIDEEHPFEDSYSEDAQATIKGYVANVIELEFDGTELNAYDINDLGLVKPYESITVEYDAYNNVTLTLTVDAQSILATEEENAYAPVVINDFSSGTSVLKYYQAKLVYNDGTATITFSFN